MLSVGIEKDQTEHAVDCIFLAASGAELAAAMPLNVYFTDFRTGREVYAVNQT